MKNLTESSTFTANVSVPEDNVDLRTAASVETAFQALANRTKHLNDNKSAGAASSTDNGIPRFDGTGGKTLQTSALSISDAGLLEYITQPTRTVVLWLPGGSSDNGTWTSDTGRVVCSTNNSQYAKEFRLPNGATLTAVRVKVDPGAARAVSGDRCSLNVVSFAPSMDTTSTPTTSTLFVSERDDGTSNVQTIAKSGLSEVIDNATKSYAVVLGSGADAASNNDRFYAVELTFTDPGPRNH